MLIKSKIEKKNLIIQNNSKEKTSIKRILRIKIIIENKFYILNKKST
jgi:hypothetical protein